MTNRAAGFQPRTPTNDVNEHSEQFQSDLLHWSNTELRSFPWREEEVTPYEVFIAEFLLRKTSSEMVEPVFKKFIKQFPTPDELVEADKDEIIEVIRPLGLYNRRSKALLEIAEELVATDVPSSEKELLDYPQVGHYVANATLCFAYDKSRPIVDTNVSRIYSRVFDIEEGNILSFAECVLPEEYAKQYNTALLDFGAKICTDSSPKCEQCFAKSYCRYYEKEPIEKFDEA